MAETVSNSLTGSLSEVRTEEWALVKRFQQGDESVFDTIVLQNSDNVSALAARLMGWSGDIDDIVQDVFFAAYLNLKKFQAKSSINTWLFTITVNQCRKRQRKQKLWKHFIKNYQYKREVGNNSHQDQLNENIRQTLNRLPGKYREPMVLRYLQEVSTEDIAKILKMNTNAVEVRLSRARQKIREMLLKENIKVDSK